jgi:ElaB/YqjD/DUF883 family membrane-anchored ribosome-binding protein
MDDNGTPSPSTGTFPSPVTGADTGGKLDRTAQAAHEKVDQLADKAEPVRERLHEGVDSAVTAVKFQVERLDRLQDAWITGARDCVREHPLASVAAAVAAGMLIERLSRRY